jgi:hypothetical protein
MSLVTYSDLIAPAVSDPAKKEADVCVTRMQETASPMPPKPAAAATSAQIATLQNWIAAGYPQGNCGADGGPSIDASVPASIYATPLMCSSGITAGGFGEGSSTMDPGQPCVSCHAAQGGPAFVFGGTVYPTAHEPDNCNGVNGTTDGAQVVITDKNGKTITMNVNSAGNFYYSGVSGAVAFPYQAQVKQGGKSRAMTTAQTTGDCNSCHTVNGANMAPGRIMLP